MAWTTPQTWLPVVVTVPDMNREVRDNFNALHPNVIATGSATAVTTADGHSVVVAVDATAGNRTVTLYTALGNTGATITVKKVDSSVNTVTIDPDTTETIDGAATWVLTAQFDALVLVSNGTNWIVAGWYHLPRQRSITGTDTAAVTDDVILVTSGTFTLTLHPLATPRHGRVLTIKNRGTGIVTVDGDGAETIDADLTVPLHEDDALTIIQTATTWIIV